MQEMCLTNSDITTKVDIENWVQKRRKNTIGRRRMGNMRKVQSLQSIKEHCKTDSWQQTSAYCQVKSLALFLNKIGFFGDSDFINSTSVFRQHTVKRWLHELPKWIVLKPWCNGSILRSKTSCRTIIWPAFFQTNKQKYQNIRLIRTRLSRHL